jgi:hypothetical protein
MAEENLPSEAPPVWRAFTPDDSPRTPDDILNDPEVRDLATPKLAVGDPAYDFDLPIHDFSDGTERTTGERFHLRERAASRPVALVFGSYT